MTERKTQKEENEKGRQKRGGVERKTEEEKEEERMMQKKQEDRKLRGKVVKNQYLKEMENMVNEKMGVRENINSTPS